MRREGPERRRRAFRSELDTVTNAETMGLMDAGRMLRTAKMQTSVGEDGRGGPGARGAGEARRVPAHVGIIMDGNGRWAAARGMPRLEGHRRGVDRSWRAADLRCRRYSGVGGG